MRLLLSVLSFAALFYAIPRLFRAARTINSPGSDSPNQRLPWKSWWFIPALIAAASFGVLLAAKAPESIGRLVIAGLIIFGAIEASKIK